MKIEVMYDFDSLGKIDARYLQILIEDNKILAFRRSSGWVKIGVDPIRGDGGSYSGPERRKIIQKEPPPPPRGCHYCVLDRHESSGDP